MKKTIAKTFIALALGLGITIGGAQTAQHVSAASGVITIQYVKGYGVALWNSPDAGRKPIPGRKLTDGTAWKFGQTKVVNGVTWYQLGTSQWVQGNYTKVSTPKNNPATKIYYFNHTGTLTVNYLYGYRYLLHSTPNGAPTKPAKYVKHGTRWKYVQTAHVGGVIWYNLGGNQWISQYYAAQGNVADYYGYTKSNYAGVLLPGMGYESPAGTYMSSYHEWQDMRLTAKQRQKAWDEMMRFPSVAAVAHQNLVDDENGWYVNEALD